MPDIESVPITDLALDLENFRTVPQVTQEAALHAMVAIGGRRFWALCDSLLTSGFHPTENIIVLEVGGRKVVKEGNRRIAALKLILSKIPHTGLTIPAGIRSKIETLTAGWKRKNRRVPCVVFPEDETDEVNRLVGLTHGKGEDAARDPWEAIAKARHHRASSPATEAGLDLLEKYLTEGRNITASQREQWAGKYPITVLDEAIRRFHRRFGATNQRQLANHYPNPPIVREALEQFLHDIGTEQVGFAHIRTTQPDILESQYGLSVVPPTLAPSLPGGLAVLTSPGAPAPPTPPTAGSNGGPTPPSPVPGPPTPVGPRAVPLDDPRSVKRKLRSFVPVGRGRDKVVTLLGELRLLNLDRQPHAFCFVLRSMFEISAKAYCTDHQAANLKATKADGSDRKLSDVLQDVTTHLTQNNRDMAVVRALHGAVTELNRPDSLLSVTSMNQLIHNPQFTTSATHICSVFHNIFPLLEKMNT